jgi:hypothetical protein
MGRKELPRPGHGGHTRRQRDLLSTLPMTDVAVRTDSRQVVMVHDERELCRVIRARCAELQITYDTLDVVAVLPDGYASKLLCEYPVKHIGALTMWSILGTLGYRIGLVHDERLLARFREKLVVRKCPPQSTGSRGRVKINFTYRFMRKIARLGGLKSGQVRHARSIKKQERSRIARTAALARWNKSRKRDLVTPQ